MNGDASCLSLCRSSFDLWTIQTLRQLLKGGEGSSRKSVCNSIAVSLLLRVFVCPLENHKITISYCYKIKG